MSEGDWGEPPPKNRHNWQRIAAELRERPGEWCMIAENRSPDYIYGSVSRSMRKAGCEVTTRQVSTEQGTFVSLWARWPV